MQTIDNNLWIATFVNGRLISSFVVARTEILLLFRFAVVDRLSFLYYIPHVCGILYGTDIICHRLHPAIQCLLAFLIECSDVVVTRLKMRDLSVFCIVV